MKNFLSFGSKVLFIFISMLASISLSKGPDKPYGIQYIICIVLLLWHDDDDDEEEEEEEEEEE